MIIKKGQDYIDKNQKYKQIKYYIHLDQAHKKYHCYNYCDYQKKWNEQQKLNIVKNSFIFIKKIHKNSTMSCLNDMIQQNLFILEQDQANLNLFIFIIFCLIFIRYTDILQYIKMLERGQQNTSILLNKLHSNKANVKIQSSPSLVLQPSSKFAQKLYPTPSFAHQPMPKHKTQGNSPVNQRLSSIETVHFPGIFEATKLHSKRQIPTKFTPVSFGRDLAKTTNILDELMKLLKEDQRSQKPNKKRRNAVTEPIGEFQEYSKVKMCKKPKIISNHMTKKFFEKKTQKSTERDQIRHIQTQDRSRKSSSNLNQKLQQYTFYGKSFMPLKLPTEGPIVSKQELEEARRQKLGRRKY